MASRLGLRARILLVLAAVLLATVGLARLVVGPVVRAALVGDLQSSARARADVVADLASITIGDTTPFEDPLRQTALQTLVERIGRLLRGHAIDVLGPRLKVFATSATVPPGGFRADDPWILENLGAAPAERLLADRIEVIVPVPIRVSAAAPPDVSAPRLWVLVTASFADIAATTQRVETLILLYLVGAAVLLLLTGWALLTTRVLRPLSALAEAVGRVSRGDLRPMRPAGAAATGHRRGRGPPAPDPDDSRGDDELGRLSRAFDRMLAELEDRREEAIRAEKLAVVGRLAAGVAHEIGNPLQAMLGYTEMLLDDAGGSNRPIPNEQRLDMLRRVQREVERVKSIVGDLVAYARPVAHEIVPVDLSQLLQQAVALMTPQSRFRGVRLVAAPAPQPAAVARAAHGPLTQVAVNLLLNAADAVAARASDPAHPGGTVQVGAARRDATGEVELFVADDGVGISRTDRRQLFDPFFTTKEPGKGTGLGLAMCQRIVDGLGGHIEVESELGNGACFRVVLPAWTDRDSDGLPEPPAPLDGPTLADS